MLMQKTLHERFSEIFLLVAVVMICLLFPNLCFLPFSLFHGAWCDTSGMVWKYSQSLWKNNNKKRIRSLQAELGKKSSYYWIIVFDQAFVKMQMPKELHNSLSLPYYDFRASCLTLEYLRNTADFSHSCDFTELTPRGRRCFKTNRNVLVESKMSRTLLSIFEWLYVVKDSSGFLIILLLLTSKMIQISLDNSGISFTSLFFFFPPNSSSHPRTSLMHKFLSVNMNVAQGLHSLS